MTLYRRSKESGASNPLLISTIGLGVLSVVAIIAAIWGISNYMAQKSDVDGRISAAVATAKKDQADKDADKFAALEKEPNREFAGPDDFGRLTFSFPKTWSVFINKDVTSGGVYEAFLNPISVPPVSASQQYALRVTIEQKDYDKVIAGYETLVKKGDLHSSAVSANGSNGTRLDGNFSKDIRGSAVIYKIRDKTATLRTDAGAFTADFNSLIATIKFNN